MLLTNPRQKPVGPQIDPSRQRFFTNANPESQSNRLPGAKGKAMSVWTEISERSQP